MKILIVMILILQFNNPFSRSPNCVTSCNYFGSNCQTSCN